MSVQTAYNFYTEKGVAGGLYDLSHHDVNSRRNECEDGVLKFGMGVVVGTVKGAQVKLPASGASLASFEGITVNGFSTEMDMDGAVAVKNEATVGVLTHGRVWARIKAGITPAYGDALYLITAGANAGLFTNATETNAIAITGGKFVGTKGTGDIAPVEIH